MPNALEALLPGTTIDTFVECLRRLETNGEQTLSATDMRALVLDQDMARLIIDGGAFNELEFSALLAKRGVESATMRNFAFMVLDGEVRSTSSNPPEEGDELQETEDPDADPEQPDDSALDRFSIYIRRNYTFFPVILATYLKFLETRPRLKKAHYMFLALRLGLSSLWTSTLDKTKAVLSMMGVAGLFLVIDEAAKRSPALHNSLRLLGTILTPVVAIYVVVRWIVRIAANPFQRLGTYIARELDLDLGQFGDESF